MSIAINIHQSFQHLANARSVVEVKGGNVGECLNDLIRQCPELKRWLFDKKNRLFHYVEIYVNQESSYPEELAMPVKDGDTLSMTLTLAGG